MPIAGLPHVYGAWVGGFNASKPAEELDPREIYDGRNIRIFPDGRARQRSGSTPFNTSALASTPTIDTFGQHAFDADTERIWAIADGKFYEDTSGVGTGFTDRTSTATITAGNKWSMANANGTLIGHNGVSGDTILKWSTAGGNVAALDVDSRFTWAKYWDFWDNRAWAANTSTGTEDVWRSDLADIETWATTSFFQIGAIVTGMRSMSNFQCIHSEDAIVLLVPTGNAVTPYRQVPKNAKGTVAPFAIKTISPPSGGEIQVYVRNDGIYAFDGEEARKLSERLDGERYWDNINTSALSNAFSIDYPTRNEVWFYLPYGSGQTTMNHKMVFNYRLGVFYTAWDGVTRNSAAIINDMPYSGGISDGFIYDDEPASSVLSDNDGTTNNAIDAWFETSAITPEGEDVTPRWLFVRTSLDSVGDYDIEFTAKMRSHPNVTATIEPIGTFDAIGTTFQIGISEIAEDVTQVLNLDTNLLGYDPHIRLRYRNAVAQQELSIRKATCVFRPIGRTRKRRSGVI